MLSLLHAEYARAASDHAVAERALQRTLRPDAPPGRLRPRLAHALAVAARRVDREVARRAVA